MYIDHKIEKKNIVAFMHTHLYYVLEKRCKTVTIYAP